MQIEHLVSGYLGWAGQTILASTDTLITRPLIDSPSKPEKHFTEYELIRSFAREGSGKSSKYVGVFYDRLQSVGRAYRDIRNARMTGDTDKAKELQEEHKEKLRLRKQYNKLQRELSKIRKAIARVSYDKTMLPAAKREKIQVLKKRSNDLVRAIDLRTKHAF